MLTIKQLTVYADQFKHLKRHCSERYFRKLCSRMVVYCRGLQHCGDASAKLIDDAYRVVRRHAIVSISKLNNV